MVKEDFAARYLNEACVILDAIDTVKLEELAGALALSRTIYVCGLGGSAAHASHMANDLRKLCGKNAICPTDNVALLTALANDEDFESWLAEWFVLESPPIDACALFLSVGGGNGRTSKSLVMACEVLSTTTIPCFAIVGRDGGHLAKLADCALVIPNLVPERVTPHVEGTTSVLLHLLVSHPALARNKPKW